MITSVWSNVGKIAASIERIAGGIAKNSALEQWADQTTQAIAARSKSRTVRQYATWRRIPSGVRISVEHPLGRWLEYGTGLYGPHRRPIVPTRREFLRYYWKRTGRVHYNRQVRGMRARPFFWRTITARIRVLSRDIMRRWSGRR